MQPVRTALLWLRGIITERKNTEPKGEALSSNSESSHEKEILRYLFWDSDQETGFGFGKDSRTENQKSEK